MDNNTKTKKLKPNVTAIIQARMQSNRLPGKVMMDLAGKPLLYHMIERTRKIKQVDRVVVATCLGAENIPIMELAESMGCDVFAGSMENVLERYHQAAVEFGGDFIVRVTADNPFVDIDFASLTVTTALNNYSDLCSPLNLPLGTAVEVISGEALQQAYDMSTRPYHFEHVSTYIKDNTEDFNIVKHPVSVFNPFRDLRLTVDTIEDYRLADILYNNLYKGSPFSIQEVISFLKKDPRLAEINSGVKQHAYNYSEITEFTVRT